MGNFDFGGFFFMALVGVMSCIAALGFGAYWLWVILFAGFKAVFGG